MKIEKIKVEGGYIAKNPMTGTWFVWIGEKNGADFMTDDKRRAVRIAKEKGGKL